MRSTRSSTPTPPARPDSIAGLVPAAAVFLAAFAAGAMPPPVNTVSEWAAEHRIVSAESGSPFPGRWRNDRAPYMVEVQDCLSLSHPCREVTLKKSAQVAGTEAGVNLFGQIVHETPAPMMIILPTVDEAKKYNKLKLQPTIDETPVLKSRVTAQTSRDGDGSTTMFKRFRGGFCQVTGANSSRGLQMITSRVNVYEEVSEYPFDVDGRGDPLALAQKRLTAWRDRSKEFYCSTPGIKGMCRISDKYEASDQRRLYVPCPHCGTHQVLVWENMRWARDEVPFGAFYECAANGCVIEHFHKTAMIAGGTWIKTYEDDGAEPGPCIEPADLERHRARGSRGREPGFAIWQAYSNFVSWDDTVDEYLRAKGDPAKEKVFTQQVLGDDYEEKGDAPEWKALLLRREDYPLGRVAPGGLIITAGVDVQKDYLQYEIIAWGIGKTSWSIDFGILEGDTASAGVWIKLAGLYDRMYADWQGREWPIEMIAVDSGYNTQAVYNFVRGRPRAMAVKGMPGHLHPALGTPSKQDVTWGGKKIRGGIMLWPVGTWTLKAEFYGNLRKDAPEPGDEAFEIGYCHYSTAHDEAYFKQATAESLITRQTRGREIREWVKAAGQANEALDCRVYGRAAAEHLGISRLGREEWERIAIERGAPPDQAQMDLTRLWADLPESETDKRLARQGAAPAVDGVPRVRGEGKVRVRGAGGVRVRGRAGTVERG